ncbi:flavin reductase (DIM6/NTAB) family NADH-FMN oxidoreductase RutF [Hephaestia caeni]|uniref:Flavin reductase (DIM6/NTAB) family NADH-FMN oxidoreductase RutF n=1 Tax=Hephaestia caeni TaxID=645617 RepID=A0A397NK88_9SPHN|nr:flavin reductase family protein [Hephaestia caeni]RIA37970.1 flavin reductase (DIM6/NTAB) family NADH-FMN oxidoreductase RutF [Hephaestia caeni]
MNQPDTAAPDYRTELRSAMRQVMASVAVITTTAGDRPAGMTATAVSMVSLDPPSLLVCVNRSTRLYQAIADAQRFRITFLSQNHCEVAQAFGGQLPQEQRFSIGAWDLGSAYGPRLADGLVDIECALEAQLDHGSHTIFIGGAAAVRYGEGPVLLYGNGDYHRAA